jgi:uncharacterized RDD family membrane protein YckC
MARASDERLQPLDDGVTGVGPPRQREVRRGGAVELAQPSNSVRPESFRLAARVDDEPPELLQEELQHVDERPYAEPVDYHDRLTISTPEGLDLSLMLAGPGSRFVSALVDLAIQGTLLIAITIVGVAIGSLGPGLFALLSFVVVFGYDVAFEVLASGRTPGKRWNGLRVVRVEGQPVGFVTSVIRNTLRVIDFLPGAYLVGAFCILASGKNQRLGDMAAGTLVVRERRAHRPEEQPLAAPPRVSEAPAWDTSAISAEELSAVVRFLERRDEIELDARTRLGHTLAEGLRPKVPGVPDDVRGEHFLEALAAAKTGRT